MSTPLLKGNYGLSAVQKANLGLPYNDPGSVKTPEIPTLPSMNFDPNKKTNLLDIKMSEKDVQEQKEYLAQLEQLKQNEIRKIQQEELEKKSKEILASNRKWEAAMSGVLNAAQGVGNYFAAKAWNKKWKKKFADMQDYSTTVGDTADIRLMGMNAANQYDPHSPTGALATAGLYNLVNQQFGGKQDIDMTPSFINAMAGVPAGIASISNWLAYQNSLKQETSLPKLRKQNTTEYGLTPAQKAEIGYPYENDNIIQRALVGLPYVPLTINFTPDFTGRLNFNPSTEYNPPIPQNRQGGTLKLIPRK